MAPHELPYRRPIARPHPVRCSIVWHDACMGLLQRGIGLVRRPLAEWHARGRGIERLATDLEASGR